MAGFLLKRLLQALFVILAVTLLVSSAIRLSGDPALMLSQGSGSVTEADLENIRQALGLNRPFWVQYVDLSAGHAARRLRPQLPRAARRWLG